MEQSKDKELYSYKQALSQPYWIQRFSDNFSLSNPIKFSLVVYGGIVGLIIWLILSKLLPFTEVGFRLMLSAMAGYFVGNFLSELVIDGKAVVFYVKDYLLFYLKYGYHSGEIYLNKGQVYKKPKAVLKQKRKEKDG